MSGKIEISSGMEDLSSQDLLKALGAESESQEALLSMFFPVGAGDAEVAASCESFDVKLPVDKTPQAGEGECGCCDRRPALASKVIDANGHATITILYDGNSNTGGGDTGMFTGLIDTATENDVVDITIMTTMFNFTRASANIFATLSLLSAIKRCKAKKIITRAGCLCSFADCALWLSGTDRRMSPMGWLAVRQPSGCGVGTMKDVEFRAEDAKAQIKVFTDYIVEMGLMTQDEVTRIYEDQTIISLSYDELDERIKNLKEAKAA